MRSFVLPDARANDYPGIFQDISQMIGIEATAKLVAEYGGTRLYIASSLNPDKKLFKLLGQEIAQKLTGEFGGLRPEIPRAVKVLAYQRNEKIRADRAAGMKVRELARNYELTERTIRKITNL